MITRRLSWRVLFLLIAAGCDEDGSTALWDGAQLRVVNGAPSSGAVDVLVDGSVVVAGLGFGATSAFVDAAAGAHTILVRPAGTGGTAGQRSLTLVAGTDYTIVAVDSASAISSQVVSDTGAVPAPGMTKLRVAHFAPGALAIDVWRTQPDFATLIRVQFPFPYGAVSPYLQSTPGGWTVVVSSESGDPTPPDTLAAMGPISIPADGVRTVVVLDVPGGGIQVQVLVDH